MAAVRRPLPSNVYQQLCILYFTFVLSNSRAYSEKLKLIIDFPYFLIRFVLFGPVQYKLVFGLTANVEFINIHYVFTPGFCCHVRISDVACEQTLRLIDYLSYE